MDNILKVLKDKMWILLLLLLVLLGFTRYGLANGAKEEVEDPLLTFEEEQCLEMVNEEKKADPESAEKQHTQNNPTQEIYVDIKGAVEQPALYCMLDHQRVQHLIDKAGGLTEHADSHRINLALVLQDEMVVYIPSIGEEVAEHLKMDMQLSPSTSQAGEGDNPGALININSATSSELTQLNGIGEKKAQAIISYREEQGPFESIEELMEVSGIGEKSFEQLKDSITVDP